MRITKEVVYEYPNLILPVPAVCFVVESDEGFDGLTEDQIDQAARAIERAVPALAPGREEPTGQIRFHSVRHSLATHIADTGRDLHNAFFIATTRTLGMAPTGAPQIIPSFEFANRDLALIAGRTAVSLWHTALGSNDAQLEALDSIYARFRKDAAGTLPSLGTRYLLEEARRRDLPAMYLLDLRIRIKRLTEMIQLGQGSKQKRFMKGMTSQTSSLGYELATYKPATSRLLADHGIPVPAQGVADTEDQAMEVARQVQFPLVVKPIDQDMGAGVEVAISDEATFREAFRRTRQYGVVQIEKYVTGFDHRITFIDYALVGVLRTTPPIITGDGKATIQELLEAERFATPSMIKGKITIDEEVLRHVSSRGYAVSDILPAEETIVLRQWWRNQRDHAIEDVTSLAHPENIEVARLAVQLIGLDVAGVDFITTDISRPYYETGAAITEVNAMPALAGVQSCGKPAYKFVLDSLFPQNDDGRIPTALFLADEDEDRTVDAAADVLRKCGLAVGIAARNRVEVAGKTVRREIAADATRVKLLLQNPQVGAAILETTTEATRLRGIPIDKCDVGVLIPPRDMEMQLSEVDSKVAKLIYGSSRKALVLNCRDARGSALLPLRGRLIWIVDDPDAGDCQHRRNGDCAIVVRKWDGRSFVCVVEAGNIQRLAEVPAGVTQSSQLNARRALLTAVGIAYGLGLSLRQVAAAIRDTASTVFS